jgi:hypothetical protein
LIRASSSMFVIFCIHSSFYVTLYARTGRRKP